MFLFLLTLFLTSCNTMQVSENNPNMVLNTSIYSSNVYIGITGRMITSEKEIEYAKLHIAHQMAMREKCIIDEGTIILEGGKDDFIISDSNFDYDDSFYR